MGVSFYGSTGAEKEKQVDSSLVLEKQLEKNRPTNPKQPKLCYRSHCLDQSRQISSSQ